MKTTSTKCKTHGPINWSGVLSWIGLGVLTASMPCFAQGPPPQGVDLRYDTLLKRQDRNKTTPGDEFGDQHGIESGSLSFNVVDVDLPGNNKLAVEFRRTLAATDPLKNITTYTRGYPATRLGDWALGLPKIQGTFDALAGWITSDSSRSTKNCSVAAGWQMQPPPGLEYPDTFRAHMFWNPPTVHWPDGSSGLLVYNDDLMPVPSSGGPYFWITSSQDVASCIAVLKNRNAASPIAEERIFGQGEGYLVTRPDGTKYWFDWMALDSKLPSISSEWNGSSAAEVVLQQATLALYPTRVEDRFGNWVTYSYSNKTNELVKLDKIQSSDGRVIDIGYVNGHLSTVTASGRTWSYFYENLSAPPSYPVDPLSPLNLTEVRNPDSSSWRYSGISHPNPPPNIQWPCDDLAWTRRVNPDATTVGDTDFTGYTVDAPSGAHAVFRVSAVLLGRSAVPDGCYQAGASSPGQAKPYTVPRRFLGGYRYALTGKKVTGPGLSPAIWKYSYQSDIGFAPMANGTSRTKVLSPNGALDTYTFGNTYGVDEGLLLAHTRTFNQQTVQSETNTYAIGTTYPGFPKLIGYHRDAIDRTPATYLRPRLTATTKRDGVYFTRTVNSLDALARPVSITKSNTIAGNPARTDVTAYHDDFSLWVMGQIKSVTCTAPATCKPASAPNGIVMSQTDYGWKALPWKTYGFGKLKQQFGYDNTSTVASGQLGTLKTVTDGRGYTTTLTGWKRGVPDKITYPATTDQPTAVSQSASVNDDGTIASVTDENGYKTCYGYDTMGRLNKITYPSETQAGVCDASAWAPTTIVFANNFPAAYGLPAGHWRQRITTGNGLKETLYDALWRPVVTQTYDMTSSATTSATISQVVTRYDAAGRTRFVSYPQRTLDPAITDTWGNPAVTPNAKGTWNSYDALDRVTLVEQDWEGTDRLITKTEYLSGFQTRLTNPRLKQTLTTLYQAFDEPTYEFPRGINHPEGQYTEIYRDVFGKPTSIKRRNADGSVSSTRNYAYNAYQELCHVVDPETGTTLMGYDAAGNMAWSAAGLGSNASCALADNSPVILARKVSRTYDARNRLTHIYHPDGRGNIAYAYAPDGLLQRIETNNDASGNQQAITTYEYNRRRLLEKETLQYGTLINWPVDYAYDGNGHLSAQIWHGVNVTYAPDALGRPTQAGGYASNVSYHPNGAIKQFTYGNGIVHTLTQNVRGLPDTSKDAYGTTAFLSDGYDYDQNGNIAAVSDGATGRNQRGNRTMVYDGLDRLTSTTSPMFGTATYTYDVLDNLTRAKVTGGNAVRDHYYCYNAQQQLAFLRTGPTCTGSTPSPSVLALEYDAQGNLKERDNVSYGFDFGNRLRSVANPTSAYAYDGHGRRVWDRTTDDKYSHYLQNGQLSMTADERRQKVAEYVYLQGSLIAIRERDVPTNVHTIKYQHTDALGSPVVITDANRAVLERSDYEPYGEAVNRAGRDGPGYTGHVEDAATGLVYMQQRYYDPMIGRFLSVDPVTAHAMPGQNFNRYWYANNNPYKFTDPDGRFGIVGAGIGAAIDLGTQLATSEGSFSQRLSNVNWTSVGVSAAVGAVTGGVGGALGKAAVRGTISTTKAALATGAVGGAASGAGKIAEGAITGKGASAGEVAVAAASGAVGAAVGARIGLNATAKLESMAASDGIRGTVGRTTQDAVQQGGKRAKHILHAESGSDNDGCCYVIYREAGKQVGRICLHHLQAIVTMLPDLHS